MTAPPHGAGDGTVGDPSPRRTRAWAFADAAALLASSLDREKVLEAISRIVIPRFAEFCAVDLVAADGTVRRAHSAHVDPQKGVLAKELHRSSAEADAPSAVHDVLRTGEPKLATTPTEPAGPRTELGGEVESRVESRLGLASTLVVPLRMANGILGTLSFGTSTLANAFTSEDVAVAQDLACAASVAIESAGLHEAERVARTKAEVESRLREELLAIVSHDLKNPLSSIVMATALLKGAPSIVDSPPRVQKFVTTISRAADTMNTLIGDLLDLTSIESGNLGVTCSPNEVSDILQSCLEILAPVASAKSIRLECATDGAGIWVLCDAPRTSQILSNIIGNAIKFTPNGEKVRIDVETIAGEARFTVSDTGPGIPEESLSHIFDRYWRASQERRTGLGLGLSIAKALVEGQGGRIWVESRLGKGSTFFFTLRAAQASFFNRDSLVPECTTGARKRRLLVVDEDKDLRESICEFLEEKGYHAVGARNSKEAMERIEGDENPDLVLIDSLFPSVHGPELRKSREKMPAFAVIPLIAMTSSRDSTDMATEFEAIVYKPLRLEQLVATIERTLSTKKRPVS